METARPRAAGVRRGGAPAPRVAALFNHDKKLCAQLPMLVKKGTRRINKEPISTRFAVPRLLGRWAFRTAFLLTLTVMLSPGTTQADSATWSMNPTNADWNTAANWTPPTVPNGRADIATFQTSTTTDISFSDATEVDRIVFDESANGFRIAVGYAQVLTPTGEGIINQSGQMQRFVVTPAGQINFFNNASAGANTLFRNRSDPDIFDHSYTEFFGHSTAGSGIFVNEGGKAPNAFGG
jgi:hypothetical protein